MLYAIVYSSKGGNTKAVAEALADALSAAGCNLGFVGRVEDAYVSAVREADTVLAGFWTDKGGCAPNMAEFLGHLASKRIFLFGTAGFGGDAEYFSRILAKVGAYLPKGATLIGSAMCQGKMGPGVRARYEAMLAEHPGDARIEGMIANFDAALTHPDAQDIERIVSSVQKALGL